MHVNTRTKLIQYIRMQLGEPYIQVNVHDEHINQIIDDVVQMFTEIAYGTLEGTVMIEFKGKGDYQMPSAITNIIKVARSSSSGALTNFGANFGANYVPDIWSEQFFSGTITSGIMPSIIMISNTQAILDKWFGDDLYYNFNPHKKVLQLFENYTGHALIHYYYEYPAEENDEIYNQMWIKRMCVAKTKFLWGTILSKYSGTLVGSAQVNASELKSDAQSEIEALQTELDERWQDPCPVLVG